MRQDWWNRLTIALWQRYGPPTTAEPIELWAGYQGEWWRV